MQVKLTQLNPGRCAVDGVIAPFRLLVKKVDQNGGKPDDCETLTNRLRHLPVSVEPQLR